MDRLGELKKTVTDMSLEELRAYVRQIRADRRISKAPAKEKKESVRNTAEGKKKVTKKLDKLSDEQLAMLLAEMEGDSEQ